MSAQSLRKKIADSAWQELRKQKIDIKRQAVEDALDFYIESIAPVVFQFGGTVDIPGIGKFSRERGGIKFKPVDPNERFISCMVFMAIFEQAAAEFWPKTVSDKLM